MISPGFMGQTWMIYLWKHQIQSAFTEAYHPNENPCERQGGALKAVVIHCLVVTNADFSGTLVLLSRAHVFTPVSDCPSSTQMANVT
jgi:hypothetical protein